MNYHVDITFNFVNMETGIEEWEQTICEGFTVLMREQIVLLKNPNIVSYNGRSNEMKSGNSLVSFDDTHIKKVIIADEEGNILFYWRNKNEQSNSN